MKSMNCISATGRMPMWAAPAAAPTIAASEIGVDHALGAEALREPLRDLERAAVQAHILPQYENAVVALHFLPQPLAQRLEIGDFGHQRFRNQSRSAARGFAYTPGSAVSPWGSGSSTQASVASSISTRTCSSTSDSSRSSTQSCWTSCFT